MRREAVRHLPALGRCGSLHAFHLRRVEIVFRLDVRSVDLGHLNSAGELFVFRFEFSFNRLVLMPVHHVQHHRPVVVGGRSIQIRHVAKTLAGVLRTFHKQTQRFPLTVIREQLQRMIDRLQEDAFFIRKDGRDYIHQLRHIRDLHDVRIVDERVQERCHHQGVFQVVALLQDAASALFVPPGAIPDVPFVKRNIDTAGPRLA